MQLPVRSLIVGLGPGIELGLRIGLGPEIDLGPGIGLIPGIPAIGATSAQLHPKNLTPPFTQTGKQKR